jgi:hypothetical protein
MDIVLFTLIDIIYNMRSTESAKSSKAAKEAVRDNFLPFECW